jgi:hypothetical protein
MTTAAPRRLPDAGADPEALIKEARRRQRRRRTAIGLAVVVLLAGTAGIAVSLTGPGGHSPGRQAPRRLPASPATSAAAFGASGLPRFFADAVITGEGNSSLEVRASGSGALVAQEEHMTGVLALAAAGADSFVFALQVGDGCAAQIYRIQLNGKGQPGAPAPVGPELHGLVWSMAADADGRVIGYTTSGCEKGDPGYIRVYDTRTARSRQWSDVNVGLSPGNVAVSGGALSMSASGRLLAFAGADVAGNGRTTSQVVRVLPTTAPAGTVAERSHVVLSRPESGSTLAAASLTPSGASFYLCTQTWSRTGHVTEVARYRTSDGALQQDLTSLRGTRTYMGCSMALDASGQFLLVPYSLNPRVEVSPASLYAMLKVAEINTTSGAVRTLTISLPGAGGMSPPVGMDAAW